MAKKKGGVLGAAVAAGAVALISKYEKEAKEQGKDINDVAKDKFADLVDNVKSGEFVEGLKESAAKLVESVKSGDIVDDAKDAFNNAVDSVKSGEALDKIKETAVNLKDGVVDMVDGEGTNSEEH